MRAVLAFVSFVGLATTGFVIGWLLIPDQPGTQVENGNGKKPPGPELEKSRPRQEKVTVSRARRADRRVAPFTTLLPVPVVTSLSKAAPAAPEQLITARQQTTAPDQDARRQGEAPAAVMAEPAASPEAAPAAPETQKPVQEAAIPEAKRPEDIASAQRSAPETAPAAPATQEPVQEEAIPAAKKPQGIASLQQPAEEPQKNRFRLPYARATKPLPGERTETPSSPTRRESSRFRRPVPESTGVLKTATKTVYLAGINALNQDEKCNLPSGESWPCGRIGTLALRRLIRSRSIVCDIIEHRDENSVLAQCKVARVDINRWVIRNGWARPAEGSPAEFGDALNAAQAEKKGQWREVSSVGN